MTFASSDKSVVNNTICHRIFHRNFRICITKIQMPTIYKQHNEREREKEYTAQTIRWHKISNWNMTIWSISNGLECNEIVYTQTSFRSKFIAVLVCLCGCLCSWTVNCTQIERDKWIRQIGFVSMARDARFAVSPLTFHIVIMCTVYSVQNNTISFANQNSLGPWENAHTEKICMVKVKVFFYLIFGHSKCNRKRRESAQWLIRIDTYLRQSGVSLWHSHASIFVNFLSEKFSRAFRLTVDWVEHFFNERIKPVMHAIGSILRLLIPRLNEAFSSRKSIVLTDKKACEAHEAYTKTYVHAQITHLSTIMPC